MGVFGSIQQGPLTGDSPSSSATALRHADLPGPLAQVAMPPFHAAYSGLDDGGQWKQKSSSGLREMMWSVPFEIWTSLYIYICIYVYNIYICIYITSPNLKPMFKIGKLQHLASTDPPNTQHLLKSHWGDLGLVALGAWSSARVAWTAACAGSTSIPVLQKHDPSHAAQILLTMTLFGSLGIQRNCLWVWHYLGIFKRIVNSIQRSHAEFSWHLMECLGSNETVETLLPCHRSQLEWDRLRLVCGWFDR